MVGQVASQKFRLQCGATAMTAAGCPQLTGDCERVQLVLLPPAFFISAIMDLAMVKIAKRHGEFVADLATQCSRLCKSQMMSMARLSPADQAGEASHIAEVAGVAKPLHL